MAATTSPALPAFSYAQAAKGLAPVTSATHSQPESAVNTPDMSSTERKASVPETERLDSAHTTSGFEKGEEAPNDGVSKIIREDGEAVSTANSKAEPNSTSTTKQSSSSCSDSKQVSESTSPSLAASLPTLLREDENSSIQNGSSESWDKQSETSATVEKSSQITEGGKDRSGDDDWVNVPAQKVEKELKAAPIPAVNIWQQRKEAQEAKAKATAASRSSAPAAMPIRQKPPVQPVRQSEAPAHDDETKRRTSGKLGEKSEGLPKKKQADETKPRDDGKRPSRPGRSGEPDKDAMESSAAPPPAGDVASWPTPEIANHDERKKSQSQDKGDSRSPGMKPNQKWVPVPYVPTAKFNTPLPPTVARRGGRPARGAREGGNRGGHVSQASISEKTDKSDKTRVMGPPPVPKQMHEQQRGRDQETQTSSRATSAPTPGRRAASVGPAFADHRKSMQTALSDRSPFESKNRASSESQDADSSAVHAANDEGTMLNKSRATSRSFSRQSASSYRAGPYDSTRHIPGDSHAHPRSYAETERRNTYAEVDRQSEVFGRRERRESNKDILKTRDLDFKTDGWRDRESASERSEHRHGRGRGGYRGRGNHPPYGAAQPSQAHAFTAPLPQQPFSGGKPHVLGERHRQSSAPYGGVGTQTHHRSASRSHSIPTHAIYPGTSNNFGPPLSPIQTDMSAFFGGYPTMYPGIMSAIPYNASLEPMALISMVSAQLEYYFSIENLCKDMYLRSNMDAQGWVPLTVIAGFNRIKSLTEDMNLIRHVCQMSRNIEYRPGDDGTDRLRKLDKWDQWILDKDQRQPHAQNEGPPPLQQNQSPQHSNPMFPSMAQMTSPTWAPGSFYNGYAEAPSFTAAHAPSEIHNYSTPIPANLLDIPSGEDFSLANGKVELSPGQPADSCDASSPVAGTHNKILNDASPVVTGAATVNGHSPPSPQEIGVENVFSNERINELHVCVRHATHPYQPPLLSSAARTFSHGSIDSLLPGGAQTTNPMPSLRGGAGSPEGFGHPQDRLTSFEFTPSSNDRGVFWMKDGTPPDSWNQEGSTSEKYQSLRDRVLAERFVGIITDDMDWLYQFWSHFLVRNFNSDMYDDFRSMAWEDAAAGHDGGLDHLSQYYGALLTGHRVLTEKLAEDIVKLAEAELSNKKQTFYQLRSTLRNGAFNLKSRRMIDKFLTPEFKDELEK